MGSCVRGEARDRSLEVGRFVGGWVTSESGCRHGRSENGDFERTFPRGHWDLRVDEAEGVAFARLCYLPKSSAQQTLCFRGCADHFEK